MCRRDDERLLDGRRGGNRHQCKWFSGRLFRRFASDRDIAEMATGQSWSREHVLAAFLNRFETVFDEWQTVASLRPFMDYWNRHDLLAGRQIAIEQEGKTEEGRAIGIDDEGRLLLEVADGVKLVHAGDVHLLWRNA